MRKALLVAAALATVAAVAVPASAATIINLDGKLNTSTNGANAFVQNFAAGSYVVTFVQDQYTAMSRWTSETGCDSAGIHCRQGWENSARIVIGDTTHLFGDGAASGGHGPLTPEDGYFKTAAMSLAHAAAYSFQFTLSEASDVRFFIYDTPVTDNRGGVSLSVAAVPEPAAWALMIAGFGLVGFSARRRKAIALA